MKLFAKKYEGSIHPTGEASLAEFEKMKSGKVYEIKITVKRNIGFHRKFFALVKFGHTHTNLEMPLKIYRKYCIMKAGYFEVYNTEKGQLFEAESISFSNMDDAEFEQVYSRVFDVICRDIGTDADYLMNELSNFI